MRGDAERQANIMLAVTPDSFVPADHPIRRIKLIVDAALVRLSPLLGSMYSRHLGQDRDIVKSCGWVTGRIRRRTSGELLHRSRPG